MKLLFLTPQLPYPPHKGTTIRNFHLLQNLGTRHEITLLSFHDGGAAPDLACLRRYCARIELVRQPRRSSLARLVDLPFPTRPDLVRRLRSAEFEARLGQLLRQEEFDLVQIEGLEMAMHWETVVRGLHGGRRAPFGPPRKAILDEHNAEYVLQRRAYEIDRGQPAKWSGAAYSLLQWRKLVRYERHICRLAAGVIAASELDRRALLALDKHLRTAVIPNGVDTDHYQPRGAREQGHDPRLIFIGTMDFRPNVDGVQWFCRRIWPGILAQVPETSLWIVGRDPKAEVRALADGQRVAVTGAVEDVRPYLASADIAVVPLRIGGGSRLKVLEAMAAGVPIVSTSLGCEGTAVTASTAVIADQPEEFGRAVVDLLRDAGRRQALAEAARDLVEQAYDWRVIVPRLEHFYGEVMA